MITEKPVLSQKKPERGFVCYVWERSLPRVIHKTRLEAQKEANRLARIEDLPVFVLELVSRHRVAIAPVQMLSLRKERIEK